MATEPVIGYDKDLLTLSYSQLSKQTIMVIIDSVPTHNFMKKELVEELEFKLEVVVNTFKEVNSQVEEVVGKTNRVTLKLNDYSEAMSFIVVLMDDFNLALYQ